MGECRLFRESVRSLRREGRDFVLRYSFTTEEKDGGQQCRIQASLTESNVPEPNVTRGCSVEMSHVLPDTARRIFEMIAGAEDPVFPVHVPEIVSDQLSAIRLVAVTSIERDER